jgi:hypothetical protein
LTTICSKQTRLDCPCPCSSWRSCPLGGNPSKLEYNHTWFAQNTRGGLSCSHRAIRQIECILQQNATDSLRPSLGLCNPMAKPCSLRLRDLCLDVPWRSTMSHLITVPSGSFCRAAHSIRTGGAASLSRARRRGLGRSRLVGSHTLLAFCALAPHHDSAYTATGEAWSSRLGPRAVLYGLGRTVWA